MKLERDMNELQPQGHAFGNSTKLLALITPPATSPAVRTRSVINAIYIAGIAFMLIVFLTLLWINLCSRRCSCWHDTSLVNRFHRQWSIKHSIVKSTDTTGAEHHRQRRASGDV